MLTSAHRLRIDALHSIATRLSGSTPEGLLADALDHLFGPTEARSGLVALGPPKLEIVAEHGLSTPTDCGPVLGAIHAILERSMEQGRTLRLFDVRRDRLGLDEAGEIAAIGCTGALAVPIIVKSRFLGAFVLLFPPKSPLDEETTLFVETVAALIAPTLATQLEPSTSASARELTPPSAAASADGMTLLSQSVGRELDGPIAALALQLEEQRRIVSDLRIFSDGSDTALGGSIAELAELTDELSATAARLRDTLDQWTRLGSRNLQPIAIEFSELVRLACLAARPGFEERGVLLDVQLTHGGYVSGQREALLQVVSDLLMLTRDRAEQGRTTPKVLVRSTNEGHRVMLSVSDFDPNQAQTARTQQPARAANALDDERRRLVLRLLGDVVAAHAGHIELARLEPEGTQYRVYLPAFGEQETTLAKRQTKSQNPEHAVVRHVLVVDDDPVFSRAARRALRPHLVREANTASEAVIILEDGAYRPDLILCDLMLPGTDGTALHRRIARGRPELATRFLFVTGGTPSKDTADYIHAARCGALKKPIDLSAVRRHLADPGRDTMTTSIVRTLRQELE